MELSVKTIEILTAKYGKGQLCGFENSTAPETFSEGEAEQAYDELTGNELIDLSEEGAHISALGHHILNMMREPEQFIRIDNDALQLDMKLYFRDAYYLCVLENKKEPGRLTVDLLPGLKQVVSAFVYALYADKEQAAGLDEGSVRVTCQSWDSSRTPAAEMKTDGVYHNGKILYRSEAVSEGRKESGKTESTVPDFVNGLTEWLFARFRETMAQEGS